VLAYALNTVATYGVAGWWNLPSNVELSLKYQTLVTPVGWAFTMHHFRGVDSLGRGTIVVPSLCSHPVVVKKVR
jgi:hypothetical protein